jgi:UDP-N-acetylglucosamine 4,6-dehydratase
MDSLNRIVIFGASGFLGTALVERLTSLGRTNIVAVARNEGGLVALNEKFPMIRTISGDIADPWTVKKAMRGADEVYLLAAMKHVGLAEIDVKTCINTNVVGCMNVVQESLITKPKTLVFISTDKASQPNGVYGCSKKIGERLLSEAEQINPHTKYRSVRYGNVLFSTGSFITKWIPKMRAGETIILTDPEASRFFWTVGEAVDLIFECVEKAADATPYIPKMKAVTMGIVLEACMEIYGRCPVKVVGLQPGENKVETTDGKTYSNEVEQFTKEEFISKLLHERH